MAKKTVYIRGSKPRQKFSDGKLSAPVTGFWHIARGRSQFHALCGMEYDSVDLTESKPKSKKDICTFCTRIANGQDPVFDKGSERSSARKPEDIGTRARPSKRDRGEVIA
jgi:hypothetical protein